MQNFLNKRKLEFKSGNIQLEISDRIYYLGFIPTEITSYCRSVFIP